MKNSTLLFSFCLFFLVYVLSVFFVPGKAKAQCSGAVLCREQFTSKVCVGGIRDGQNCSGQLAGFCIGGSCQTVSSYQDDWFSCSYNNIIGCYASCPAGLTQIGGGCSSLCPAGQSYCSGCGCKDTTQYTCNQWIANSCNAPNPCASVTRVNAGWCGAQCGSSCTQLVSYLRSNTTGQDCGGYDCRYNPSGCGCQFCGDGACNGSEICWNGSSGCPDCGNCCGNDLRTIPRNICQPSRGETCYNVSTGTGCSDCGTCPYCGDGSCNGTEICSNIPNDRTGRACEPDCGICEPFCGDEACNGFEQCYNKFNGSGCLSDCGECDYTWWQAENAQLYAAQDQAGSPSIFAPIYDDLCTPPDCLAWLILPDATLEVDSTGIALTGGGDVDVQGFVSESDWTGIGTEMTRYQENYSYFYRQTDLGLNPVDDFPASGSDARKPASGQEVYFHSGDMIIEQPWNVAAGETYVIFVDGNLTLRDPFNYNQLITTEEGGFISFIVSGDIYIDPSLGNENFDDKTPNLEGIFLADGNVEIQSRGVAGGGDDRFVGAGSYISWGTIKIDRNFDDGGTRDTYNDLYPTEFFIYRPDLLINTPDILKHGLTIWQETN